MSTAISNCMHSVWIKENVNLCQEIELNKCWLCWYQRSSQSYTMNEAGTCTTTSWCGSKYKAKYGNE